MEIDLSTSSERFRKGVSWLEGNLRFDEEKMKKIKEREKRLREISEEKSEPNGSKTLRDLANQIALDSEIMEQNMKSRLKYRCHEVKAAYVLKKVNSKLVEEFVSSAGNPAFWVDAKDHIFEDSHELWFLKEVGLGDNPQFLEEVEDLIRQQSVEGYIHSNEFDHTGPLRVLVATRPESSFLSNAVKYWLKNWKDLSSDAGEIAVGILALTELNYEKYSNAIREEIDYLKSFQNEDGSWSLLLSEQYSKEGIIDKTCYAVWAISRIDGIDDSSAQKGLRWLIERQQENGSWENHLNYTELGLLGLLAMGEGPKAPLELVEHQFMRLRQSLRKEKPVFIHTSPLYQGSLHVKEIHDKISNMLHNAQMEIRIASPFIDMLYEEIINLKQEKPDLTIKIITRPKIEAEGMRERIAKNVVDLLSIATKGNIVQSNLVHSRMIIIDDEEVLISSADLTRDQLFDEFNAGIWTSDKETVGKAIDFFENLFQLEKGESKSA